MTPAQLGPFLSGYTSRRVFFTYYRCPRCRLVYCPTHLGHAELDRLYREQPENMEDAPLDARAATQREYFRLLQAHSPLTDGYLELGADVGLFAELCAREGRFDDYWLYEPNERVHGQLAKRLAGRPYTVRRFYTPDAVPKASVSTAVAIHVLDHVLDPCELLQSIRRALRPGAVLFVVTHDVDSGLARVLRHRWPPYTLQHPQLYGRRSIQALIERAGFELVNVVKTRNYFPAAFLANAVLSILGARPLVPRWNRPMVGLRLGNIATIARA